MTATLTPADLIEVRVRTRTSPAELEAMIGKVPETGHVRVMLTGPAAVYKPDGTPLAVYLPGVLTDEFTPDVYGVLASLSKVLTKNRGYASGTPRMKYPNGKRSTSASVSSAIIGAWDGPTSRPYCRLTAWTGEHLPEWQRLHPLLRAVADCMRAHVPARHAAQTVEAGRTDPAWVVPGTPFTTVTVNNSYATGMHTDRGDLHEGFSTIAVCRRGNFTGGVLNFPEYRLGVDLGDGDLILMDSHEWHANTPMVCACGRLMMGPCRTCGAERISVVSYFRTKVAACGSPGAELRKGQALFDERASRLAAGESAKR